MATSPSSPDLPLEGPEQLLRFVRSLRESERGWRQAASRTEDALREERERLGRARESTRQLTQTLGESNQRVRRLELELEQERRRAGELEERLSQSSRQVAEFSAGLPLQAGRIADLEGELAALQAEREELLGLARRRDRQDEERATLKRQVSELSLAWERSQEQVSRLVSLEQTVLRLEEGKGLRRVAELELALADLEERATRAEARGEILGAELGATRARAEHAEELGETLARELEGARADLEEAWERAEAHEAARLVLRQEVDAQLHEAEEALRAARSKRALALADRHVALRQLAEARSAEAALWALAESAEAERRGREGAAEGLLVERLAAQRALQGGREAIAALREKLLAARRVQSLSARLANLVCPPGAEDTRQDRGDYALVLQLREAQRELRRSWTHVEEAEAALGEVETELGDRLRGQDLLRQERRLRGSIEQQRDALLGALEERTLELEALERELAAQQGRLDSVEREAEQGRETRVALARERELSLTARRQRAQVVAELRERDARLREVEAERDTVTEERDRVQVALEEASARVQALRGAAAHQHDLALQAGSPTERFRKEQAEREVREELQAAEAERDRLQQALVKHEHPELSEP